MLYVLLGMIFWVNDTSTDEHPYPLHARMVWTTEQVLLSPQARKNYAVYRDLLPDDTQIHRRIAQKLNRQVNAWIRPLAIRHGVGIQEAFLMTTGVWVPLNTTDDETDKDLDFATLSLTELLNVEIVTASGGVQQKVVDIPASVVVITREEIEQQAYATFDDILIHVLGMYGLNERQMSGVTFGVRGFYTGTAQSIALLVNGIKQNRLPTDGATYLGLQIPVTSIDRIEVVRGPMSVIYGSGAFFGAINVITNHTQQSMASASIGNQNTSRVDLRKVFHEGKLKISLNAGHYASDGPDEPYSRMSSLNLAEEFAVDHETTDKIYGLETLFFSSSFSYGAFWSGNLLYERSDFDGDIFFPGSDRGVNGKRTHLNLSLGRQWKVSDTLSVDLNTVFHKGTIQTDLDWFTTQVSPGGHNLGGDHNGLEYWEVNLSAFWQPGKRLALTSGLYYKKTVENYLLTYVPFLDISYRSQQLSAPRNLAAFAQAELKVTERLNLTLGVRADQLKKYETFYQIFTGDRPIFYGPYTHDDVEVLPRMASIFKISDTNIIKLIYGEAINHPNIHQVSAQAPAQSAPVGPEFIKTIEVNHLWSRNKVSLNSSIFFNKLDQLIVLDPILIDGAFVALVRNSGQLETKGLEVDVRARPGKKLELQLSMSLQKTEDKTETFNRYDVANSPEILGYARVSYKIGSRSSLSVMARHVGEMKTSIDLGVFEPGIEKDEVVRIGNDTDAYTIVDVGFRANNLWDGYYVQFSSSNIFNKKYLHPTQNIQPWADKGLIGDPAEHLLTVGKKF